MGLAALYEQGRGVVKDPVQARKWYVIASADDGEYDAEMPARAKKAADALKAKMTPAQIEQADKFAMEFKPATKR